MPDLQINQKKTKLIPTEIHVQQSEDVPSSANDGMYR